MAMAYEPAIAMLARLGCGCAGGAGGGGSAARGGEGSDGAPLMTAADKLSLIAESIRAAQRCVSAHYAADARTGRSGGASVAMAAEDLLPVLAFVAVHAQVRATANAAPPPPRSYAASLSASAPALLLPSSWASASSATPPAAAAAAGVGCWLHAEVETLSAFVPDHLMAGEHGYCLISLVSALSLLDGLAATLRVDGWKN
jgi:hypothetical protein